VKYHVNVGDADVEVVLEGDTATVDGASYRVSLSAIENTPVHVLHLGDEVHRIVVRRAESRGRYSLWVDGFRVESEALDERALAIRALAGVSSEASGPAPIVAPMPGMIVRVSAQVGDDVQPGQGLVVMEAMKMENELRAMAAGRVRAVLVQPGQAVEKGTVLLELE
jgi:biotin carboxyl carrier protein